MPNRPYIFYPNISTNIDMLISRPDKTVRYNGKTCGDGGDGMVSTQQDNEWNNHQNEIAQLKSEIKWLKGSSNITPDERTAYQWALMQDYQSVAAKYAKTLAKALQRILGW